MTNGGGQMTKIFLFALALGVIMAILYSLGLIPAWLAIVLGWIGGIGMYKIWGK